MRGIFMIDGGPVQRPISRRPSASAPDGGLHGEAEAGAMDLIAEERLRTHVKRRERCAAATPQDVYRLARLLGLTPRQAEVALLLCERRANREIAVELGISPHTAKRHTELVMLRLGVRKRQEVEPRLMETHVRLRPSGGEQGVKQVSCRATERESSSRYCNTATPREN